MDVVTSCVLQKCAITESLCKSHNKQAQMQLESDTCSNLMTVTKNITNTACNMPIRDRTAQYITTSNTLGIITGIFVMQRIAYKVWAGLDFGWDDFFCLFTTVSGIPITVINAHWLPQNGLGRDIWTLKPEQITEFGLCFYIIEALYFLLVGTLKLSLLFFYTRVFPSNGVRGLLWGTIGFVSTMTIIFLFLSIFQCTPIKFFWLKWDDAEAGYCMNTNALAWCNAVLSIATDIWMLAVPLWQLRTLQLDRKRKFGVGVMFSVGTLQVAFPIS